MATNQNIPTDDGQGCARGCWNAILPVILCWAAIIAVVMGIILVIK